MENTYFSTAEASAKPKRDHSQVYGAPGPEDSTGKSQHQREGIQPSVPLNIRMRPKDMSPGKSFVDTFGIRAGLGVQVVGRKSLGQLLCLRGTMWLPLRCSELQMGSEHVKPPDLGVHREHRPRCLRFCPVYPPLLHGITLVLDGGIPAKAQGQSTNNRSKTGPTLPSRPWAQTPRHKHLITRKGHTSAGVPPSIQVLLPASR